MRPNDTRVEHDGRLIPVTARPITRPRADHENEPLVTRRHLAYWTRRNIDVIARYCKPVACDVTNRALLYRVTEAEDALGKIPQRQRVTDRSA